MSTRPEERGHRTACWIWTGQLNERGYGLIRSKLSRLAHRAVWIETNGPIPDGLEIDHLCRQRDCVNPTHMELVTRSENMRRAYALHAAPAPPGLPAVIQEQRLALSLSQSALARLLGCSQSLIAMWERGSARPGRRYGTALLAFLLTEPRLDPSGAVAQAGGADGQTFGGRRAV